MYDRDPFEASEKLYQEKFESYKISKSKCFNIGSGVWEHPGWTNIDLPPQSEEFAKIQSPCIFHNLVENDDLPIKNGTAELLYTSHTIEHLPEDQAYKLLKSSYKSLKKGGKIRIVTGPNADTDYQALIRGDRKWWFFFKGENPFNHKISIRRPINVYDYWLLHFATPKSIYSPTPCPKKYSSEEIRELVNEYKSNLNNLRDMLTGDLEFNINYPGNHLSWWSPNKAIKLLKEVGFSNAYESFYGQSSEPIFRDTRYFDTTYPQISMYVEADK